MKGFLAVTVLALWSLGAVAQQPPPPSPSDLFTSQLAITINKLLKENEALAAKLATYEKAGAEGAAATVKETVRVESQRKSDEHAKAVAKELNDAEAARKAAAEAEFARQQTAPKATEAPPAVP